MVEQCPRVSCGSAEIVGVPGAHYRIASAKAALVACETVRPEVVAVEIPNVFVRPLVRALRELYPVPCVVMGRHRKQDLGYAICVVPSDSICQAARWGVQHEVPVVGVDLLVERENNIDRAMGVGFDDWIWDRVGLQEGLRLCNSWITQNRTEADKVREEYMVRQLSRCARSFSRILWVGGAAHFEAIAAGLGESVGRKVSNSGSHLASEKGWDFSIALLDPAVALRRYLDDLPRSSWTFHLIEGKPQAVAAFDKWTETEKILADAIEHYRLAYKEPSPRAVLHFETLLKKMLAHQSFLTPRPHHLYEASHAAVSDEFANLLLEKALDYPFPRFEEATKGASRTYPMLTESGEGILCNHDAACGTETFAILRRSSTQVSAHGREAPTQEAIEQRIRRAASLATDNDLPPRWESCSPESALAQEMCCRARTLARETLPPERRPTPFAGSLGEGVDVRATIRRRCRGLNEPCVTVLEHQRENLIDNYEPVLWHLMDPREFDSGTYLYGWRRTRQDREEWLFYSFFWATNRNLQTDLTLWNWGISVSFVPLTWNKPQVREWIQTNADRVPTANMFAERGVGTDNVLERVGIVSVKHARRAVVWVSPSPAEIPETVRSSAAAQGKRLVHVRLDRFAPEGLSRLASYHLFRTDDPSDDIVTPRDVLERIEKHRENTG